MGTVGGEGQDNCNMERLSLVRFLYIIKRRQKLEVFPEVYHFPSPFRKVT
jgi:hypothetical protein